MPRLSHSVIPSILALLGRGMQLLLATSIYFVYGAGPITDSALTQYAFIALASGVIANTLDFTCAHLFRMSGPDLLRHANMIKTAAILSVFISALVSGIGHLVSNASLSTTLALLLIPPLSSLSAILNTSLVAKGMIIRSSISMAGGGVLALATLAFLHNNECGIALSLLSLELGRTILLGANLRPPLIQTILSSSFVPTIFLKSLSSTLLSALNALLFLAPVATASLLATGTATKTDYALKLWSIAPLALTGHISWLYHKVIDPSFSATSSPDISSTIGKIQGLSVIIMLLLISALTIVILGNVLPPDATLLIKEATLFLSFMALGTPFYTGTICLLRVLAAQGLTHLSLAPYTKGLAVYSGCFVLLDMIGKTTPFPTALIVGIPFAFGQISTYLFLRVKLRESTGST